MVRHLWPSVASLHLIMSGGYRRYREGPGSRKLNVPLEHATVHDRAAGGSIEYLLLEAPDRDVRSVGPDTCIPMAPFLSRYYRCGWNGGIPLLPYGSRLKTCRRLLKKGLSAAAVKTYIPLIDRRAALFLDELHNQPESFVKHFTKCVECLRSDSVAYILNM